MGETAMCTIITTDTIDESLFSQIRSDAQFNPHGLSAVTFDGQEYQIIKTHDPESLIHSLSFKPFKRVWVHTRNATTWARGITATHAFIQGDYIVFHNGVLSSSGAKQHPVDSMLLCDLLKYTSPVNIQAMLNTLGETWANVMIVDTKLDRYYIIRQNSGSLHTDAHGNFSTNPFSEISVPVGQNTSEMFSLRPAPAPIKIPDRSYVSDIWDRYYSPLTDSETLSETEILTLKDDLRMIGGPDDFVDLVYDFGFEKRSTRSEEFYKLCNTKQRSQLRSIQKRASKIYKRSNYLKRGA
jgi:hypothetical protein